jgi:hypothetical protein
VIKPDSSRRNNFVEVVIKNLVADEQRRDTVINEVLGYEAFNLHTPLITKAILNKASSVNDILNIALDVRESKSARHFRKFCATVDHAVVEGNRLAGC